jgi:Sec-independent protein secretion pathway component TatC
MHLVVVLLYIIAAVICGLLGRKTSFGFLGHFIVALIITPIGDFLVQLIARPSREVREKMNDMEDY